MNLILDIYIIAKRNELIKHKEETDAIIRSFLIYFLVTLPCSIYGSNPVNPIYLAHNERHKIFDGLNIKVVFCVLTTCIIHFSAIVKEILKERVILTHKANIDDSVFFSRINQSFLRNAFPQLYRR